MAEEICKAVVNGQAVTEDNIDGMISQAKMMAAEAEPEEAEPVPEHLADEPF